MRTIDHYATEARVHTFHDRRRRSPLPALKPGVQWDYNKIMYFVLTMLGGSVVWAFVFGAIRYSVK